MYEHFFIGIEWQVLSSGYDGFRFHDIFSLLSVGRPIMLELYIVNRKSGNMKIFTNHSGIICISLTSLPRIHPTNDKKCIIVYSLILNITLGRSLRVKTGQYWAEIWNPIRDRRARAREVYREYFPREDLWSWFITHEIGSDKTGHRDGDSTARTLIKVSKALPEEDIGAAWRCGNWGPHYLSSDKK